MQQPVWQHRGVAGQRVVVVGGPGSGKTWLAGRLAERLGAVHVEVDELWWSRPGWVHVTADELRAALAVRLEAAGGRWVVDGNYLEEIGAQLWPAADTLVWLDLPRRRAVTRAVLRSARRVLTRRPLWNGNREVVAVLSPWSVARLWRRWPHYGSAIESSLADLRRAGHPEVVRLRTGPDVDRWLSAVAPWPTRPPA